MVLQIKIKLEKGMRVQAILNEVVMDGLSDKVTFETYYFNCVLGRGGVTVLKCNWIITFFP